MAKEKQQRLTPENRRQLLLQATRDTLAKYGAQGTGVREICNALGVSPGLLTHYFAGKESLFLAAYEDMAQGYLREMEAAAGNGKLSAEGRLKELFRLYFSRRWAADDIIGTYTSFWSLSQTIPELKSAFEDTFQQQLTVFEQLIHDLVDERGLRLSTKPFATFLLVFLEGVWLESCLNPKTVDKDSIEEFCWDWLECYMAAKEKRGT
ncbi:TetR/AcrR family transcriptional regulator [Nitratireductor sp. XY-223]|uniref:TetR/AcrR family transcriptional regulator n=1 Tax=Nitratireductor sp. XY-223 TaxID=2561926 RepID=UPI00145ABCFB|nr:TetR/AcrR family transcriptional regulator [Nitratireductor sp. XY-223]